MPREKGQPLGVPQQSVENRPRQILLDALWRDKTHVEPQALERSPRQVREAFASIWEPAMRMRRYLALLPKGLLSLWHAAPGGHLIYTDRPSAYAPGPQPWRGEVLQGVCYLSVADVALAPQAALVALCSLFDHLLGSGGDPEGPWFADGAGITESLRRAAERFGRIHALGYGHDALAAPTARAYLAHTWALYLTDPRRLNVLDPQVFRLYRDILMAESPWSLSQGSGG